MYIYICMYIIMIVYVYVCIYIYIHLCVCVILTVEWAYNFRWEMSKSHFFLSPRSLFQSGGLNPNSPVGRFIDPGPTCSLFTSTVVKWRTATAWRMASSDQASPLWSAGSSLFASKTGAVTSLEALRVWAARKFRRNTLGRLAAGREDPKQLTAAEGIAMLQRSSLRALIQKPRANAPELTPLDLTLSSEIGPSVPIACQVVARELVQPPLKHRTQQHRWGARNQKGLNESSAAEASLDKQNHPTILCNGSTTIVAMTVSFWWGKTGRCQQ